MKVIEHTIDDGRHLASLYNERFADGSDPHCHPVTEQEFAVGLTQTLRHDSPMSAVGVHALRLLAVERACKPVALSHIATEAVTTDGRDTRRGLIRLFAFAPGDRAAGQCLLEASEARLMSDPVEKIVLAPWSAGVRFMHSGREEPSTLQPHLLSLARLNRYAVERTQHIMTCERIGVDKPALRDRSMNVDVEARESRGRRPNVVTRLMRDGTGIGSCELESRGHFLQAEAAQTAVFVHDLEVHEAFQRSGHGRYLLRRALWEARRVGFTNASLCVLPDNHRAIMLYAAEGFSIAGTGHQLGKEVD